MTQLFEIEEENPVEEDIDMGSANHALVRTRLIRTLPEDKFTGSDAIWVMSWSAIRMIAPCRMGRVI